MTGQMADIFMLAGDLFSLVGMRGQELCKPDDFGINPLSNCTACWRGYQMKYHFINNQLFLDEMLVNGDDPPIINGIRPQNGARFFKYYYKNLKYKTTFTGKILLAKDFIQSMYVHMGFQRPMAFKTIIEIKMKDGKIISEKDLSKEMEEKRIKNVYEGASPRSDSKSDIKNWVEETFSLDYDF